MSEESKPHVVKSHDIGLDSDYVSWVHDVKQRYVSAQIKSAVKVNTEQLFFNWQLGRDLVERKAEEKWGKGIVEQLSLDLQNEFPEAKGFLEKMAYQPDMLVYRLCIYSTWRKPQRVCKAMQECTDRFSAEWIRTSYCMGRTGVSCWETSPWGFSLVVCAFAMVGSSFSEYKK